MYEKEPTRQRKNFGPLRFLFFTAITNNVEATCHDDISGKENKAPFSKGR